MENEEPDFSGKKVAFFGAGDQDTHGEEFISALGKMKETFSKLGADTEYGYWPTEGYTYQSSLAEKDGKFCGLAIDNINQEDLTPERITTWAEQLKNEMGI
jgi:flavodoxin I